MMLVAAPAVAWGDQDYRWRTAEEIAAERMPSLCEDSLAQLGHPRETGQFPYGAQDRGTGVRNSAEEVVDLKFVGSALWQQISGMVIRDSLLFCATPNGLLILDVSDPVQPSFVSKLYFPAEEGNDLAVVGDLVLYSNYTRTIHAIDVSDPATPVEAGTFTLPGVVYALDMRDTLAYVAYGYSDEECGLRIVDVSDPGHMLGLSKVPGECQPNDVWLRGDYAYYSADIISVIDISDPSAAEKTGEYSPVEYVEIMALAQCEGDTMACTVDLSIVRPAGYAQFNVLSLADESLPHWVGRQELQGYVTDVEVLGDAAFVANGSRGIKVFDLTDPTAPDSIGYHLVAAFAGYLALQDTFLYVSDWGPQNADVESSPWGIHLTDPEGPQPGDLMVLNVADPANPELVGFYSFPGMITNAEVTGDLVLGLHGDYYNPNGYGMSVLDATDLSHPELIGWYETFGAVQQAVVRDTLVYLAAGAGGLEVVNLSDPADPVLLGRDTIGAGAFEIALRGDYAYMANFSSGFTVLDISDPTNPTTLGGISTPGLAFSVVLYQNYAYVAWVAADCGISIFDISWGDSAAYVSGMQVTYNLATVRMAGDLLISEGYGGLTFYDLTDPLYPATVSLWGGHAFSQNVEVYGDYVFHVDGWYGMQVINISDPSTPVQVGSFDTPYFCEGLAVDESHVYVADTYNMTILEWDVITGIGDETDDLLPETFVVRPVYPNPFNPSTEIRFNVSREGIGSLRIYNIRGQAVRTLESGRFAAGPGMVVWDGRADSGEAVGSGVYFYRLAVGAESLTKRMVLLK